MPNPNYNSTVTLYRKIDGEWQRDVYEGCSWVSQIVMNQSGTSETQVNTYTVRIPLSIAGEGFVARAGDVAVLGECNAEIDGKTAGKRASEVLAANKPGAFQVKLFSDNTGHLVGKHYRLGG